MSQTDEQIIRHFFERYVAMHSQRANGGDFPNKKYNAACAGEGRTVLAALDRLMQRVVPELPEGWAVHQIQEQMILETPTVYCCLYRPLDSAGSSSANGPTIHAAVNAAIAKIGSAP